MAAEGENLFVGLVALALLPLIGLRMWRGLRDRRLPVYRTYLNRDDAPGKYRALLAIHILSLLLIAAVSADLLLNLGLRNAL